MFCYDLLSIAEKKGGILLAVPNMLVTWIYEYIYGLKCESGLHPEKAG